MLIMKKNNFMRLLMVVSVITTVVWACQTNDLTIPADTQGEISKSSSAKVAACPPVYALVLTGSAGSPVPAGFQSFIYQVNPCSSPVGFTAVSQIKIGVTPVTSVTGLCDMPGVVDMAWAVTGASSNFPKRLLRVKISTGAAAIVSTTTDFLQDIENYGNTGLFVAIKEGTSQLLKVTVPSGVTSAFAPAGPTAQYNGLTVVGTKFQAISGLTNLVCNPNTGDIFEYPTTGGPYTAKYSYKNLPGNGTWTMKELGFHFDACCAKRWMVGSSSNILSHNVNITACVPSSPVLLLQARPIYDFMVKP
jgi:hypothetical protein